MSDLNINSCITTHSGLRIPQLGLGNVPAPNAYFEVIEAALQAGYRHCEFRFDTLADLKVDTAQMYGTEQALADALSQLLPQLDIPRSEVFICTKYNPPDCTQPGPTAEEVHLALQSSRSIFEPKLGYIDLLLHHQPRPGPEGRKRAWEAMARAKEDGWVREIGVSNMSIQMMQQLPPPLPAVNQIEIHPWYQQRPLVEYCQSRGIAIIAYFPLAHSDPRRMSEPVLVDMAERYGKTVWQILLRWSLQHGIIPIPGSTKPERVLSNADLFDFILSESDMAALDGLEAGRNGTCSTEAYDFLSNLDKMEA